MSLASHRYKISIKKSIVFLYTNDEHYKSENKKMIPFKIASKLKISKYLGANLTKEV